MSKNSEKVMRAQKRKKKMAVERMGGKCQICGYDKCLSALEFHHVNKDEKEECPSYIILRWAWERAKVELEKCILVCSNCHKEIHDEECGVSLEVIRERQKKPFIKRVCEVCGDEFETKDYEQRFCSINCSSVSQRKVDRPSKSELKKLLESKVSWTKLGKMFGVSDNAVRKWAKKYELI